MSATPQLLPGQRLVRLQQCTRKRCGLIYPDDEAEKRQKRARHWTHHCPKCGCSTYYSINGDGTSTKGGLENWKDTPWPPAEQLRPVKPCVVCQGTGKVADLLAMKLYPRKRCERKDCSWCGGTGRVFVSTAH